MLHNDLKPDNILLEEDSPNSDIKVAILGWLAKRLGLAMLPRCGDTAPWIHGSRGGPVRAMLKKLRYVRRGVLYFMLCGEPHFEYENGM